MNHPLPAPPKRRKAGGIPRWTVTLADMFSLLLTFFILMLSMARVDAMKFQAAAESLRTALGNREMVYVPVPATPGAGPAASPVAIREVTGNERVARELETVVANTGLRDTVSVRSSSRGVLLQVQGQVFFEEGADRIKPGATPFLDDIARIIRNSPYHVAIEGHTDDTPIHTARFPSNWELSTSRAISTLRYLAGRGVSPLQLSSAGFADTRPLAPNDTVEHQRQNRRVEFVFSTDTRRTD